MLLMIKKNSLVLLIIFIVSICLSFYSCGGDYPSDSPGTGIPGDDKEDEELVFEISHPPKDRALSGTIDIAVTVISGSLDRIEFYIDDELKISDRESPYNYDWKTTDIADDSYTIKLIAYDDEGSSYEKTLDLVVDNTVDEIPPVIRMISPETGSFIKGDLTISAEVSDNISLSSVEFLIDGNSNSLSSTTDSYEFIWDTSDVSNGERLISFKAIDTSGNETIVNDIKVFVLNRDERDCPGQSSNWDLTGIWATTIGTEPPTEFNIYIIQDDPCNGSTFSSWGYDPESNTFASAPGTISENEYTLLTDSWPRQEIKDNDNTIGWLQIDDIFWVPSNSGNNFAGNTRVTLYQDQSGGDVHPWNEHLPSDDYLMTGIRSIEDQGVTDPEELAFEITQPASEAIVSGTTKIIAGISSGAITHVEFYIDDLIKFDDDTSPYEYDWETTITTDGEHTIKLVAYDDEGSSYEKTLDLVVDNTVDEIPPVIRMISPETGSFIKGDLTISAEVSDNTGVNSVEFLIDDVSNFISSTTDSYEFIWDTTKVSNGEHLISFKASDAAGNKTIINDIKVFVLNRDETDCQGDAPSWDLTGTWATTIKTKPPTEFNIYIIQDNPCNANTFSSWGYDSDVNTFVGVTGTILENKYTLTTASWARQEIKSDSCSTIGWLQIDEISWTPSNSGNSFAGKTMVTLYKEESGGGVHLWNSFISDYDMNGVRNE